MNRMIRNLKLMIAFARRHDWGAGVYIEGDAVMVLERLTHVETGEQLVSWKPMHTMAELRAWAGY